MVLRSICWLLKKILAQKLLHKALFKETSSTQYLPIVCFASGNGTNLQALIDAHIKIDMLITDNPNAYAIQRAQNANIPYYVITKKKEWINAIPNNTVLIILAGFMKILPPDFVNKFRDRIINIHPSLLPSFPGLDAIKQAYDYGVKYTGVTAHYVDEGIDTGSIIAQKAVYIPSVCTLADLEENIHQVEHELYSMVIKRMLRYEDLD